MALAFKELKRKDAERLASFTEKAVELGHEASDVKRLAVRYHAMCVPRRYELCGRPWV